MRRVNAAASEWDGALVGRGWVLGGWGGSKGRAHKLSYLEPSSVTTHDTTEMTTNGSRAL